MNANLPRMFLEKEVRTQRFLGHILHSSLSHRLAEKTSLIEKPRIEALY